ncbi:hypothetical protein D3C71_1655370 [compost metagenome]
MALSANSLRATTRHSSLNSRSERMNATSLFLTPAALTSLASRSKLLRSVGVARLAALRQMSRSISRRVSSRRSCLPMSIVGICKPRCGITTIKCSRASRCTASRSGVRPTPVISLSLCSETSAPGGILSVTMASSRSW